MVRQQNRLVGNDSEVIVKPVAVFDDPFNVQNRVTETANFEKIIYVLVLCETYTPDNKPLPFLIIDNTR